MCSVSFLWNISVLYLKMRVTEKGECALFDDFVFQKIVKSLFGPSKDAAPFKRVIGYGELMSREIPCAYVLWDSLCLCLVRFIVLMSCEIPCARVLWDSLCLCFVRFLILMSSQIPCACFIWDSLNECHYTLDHGQSWKGEFDILYGSSEFCYFYNFLIAIWFNLSYL